MKKFVIALTIFASAFTGSQAGIILNDTFDYNPDPAPLDLVGAPGSAWVANSGATSAQVATNSLIVTSLRAQDVYRAWQSGPTAYMTNSAAVLYSSYTLHCTFLPNTAGTYFSHFGGTNCFTSSTATITGHRCRVYSSLTNGVGGTAGEGQWYLSVVNTSGSAESPVTNSVWPAALDTNTTYTIVTRYVVATGESTLWVDPTSEISASVINENPLPWDWTPGYLGEEFPRNGPINIGFYNFRQASGEGTMIIDNLKVGTSFADVAGANTAPILNAPVAQATPMNTILGPVGFTVEDAETAASALTVTATSSNTGLVPDGEPNIVLTSDASGTNRTITVTPATGQQGSTTITLAVSDGVNSTPGTFVLTVGAPSIAAIPNQITTINTATPAIPFTVSDAENDTLTVSKDSSNPTLVTTSGISVSGSGSNRTVAITPEANQTGVAIITLTVGDGFNTASTSFTVTVSPSLGVIFSEPFDYPDGQLYGSGLWPWAHASPTGTNFGQLQVTNGQAQLSRSQAEDVAAPLTGGPFSSSQGVVFYTGFQVLFTELPSSGGSYFIHFRDSDTGTTFRGKVFANTSGAAPGQFRLGVSSSANVPSPQFGRELLLNQPYIVVTRYNAGTGETRLWVNPTSESSPSVDSTDTPLTSQVGSIGLREDSGIGVNYIDNLVISTSFADVVPAIVRPALTTEVDNLGNLIVSWNNGFFALQSATDVSGPYADIPGATSPYTNTISGQLFFRARY